MGIRMDAAACNNIGGRKNNEDNYYLNGAYMKREEMDRGGVVARMCAQPVQCYAVFDGMGGASNGEDAAAYAAQQLGEYQKKCPHPEDPGSLRRFFTEVSEGINDISRANGLRPGACGSTAAMVVVGDDWFRTVHVGDSRVYLLRGGQLSRVTRDQSEVQRLVDAGQITPEEAWSHPRRNVITRHLGMALRSSQLDSVIGERMPLSPGDLLMICSDGVNDNLRDAEIRAALDPAKTARENAEAVVQASRRRALEMRQESDNITAVILKIRSVANEATDRRRLRMLLAGCVLSGLGAAACALTCAACIVKALM